MRQRKRLKTASSDRVVPGHPELLDLLLIDFVANRRRAGEAKLFSKVGIGGGRAIGPRQLRVVCSVLATAGESSSRPCSHSFRHGRCEAQAPRLCPPHLGAGQLRVAPRRCRKPTPAGSRSRPFLRGAAAFAIPASIFLTCIVTSRPSGGRNRPGEPNIVRRRGIRVARCLTDGIRQPVDFHAIAVGFAGVRNAME